MSKPALYLVIALVLLMFWAIGASQRMARLRIGVAQAFPPLDAVLGQQLEWIIGFVHRSAEDGAMGEAEAADCQRLGAAARQLELVLAHLRKQPADASAMAGFACARAALQGALARTTESRAQPIPAEWTRLVHQEAPVGAVFNAAVTQYNQALRQFPASGLAWMLRQRPAQPFLLAERPAHREPDAVAA